jgi:hypothetical protein
MKKIFLLTALIFAHFFNVQAQKNDLNLLFDKYQDQEGITSIKIAKPMFGMLNSLNIADSQLDQIKPLLSKIDGLKILISEGGEDTLQLGKKLSTINKEISAVISKMNYSELMSVKSGGNKVKFLSSAAKDGMLDDLLLSIKGDEGENILVMLDGKLSMDDVNKIINSGEKGSFNVSLKNNLTSGGNSYVNSEARNVGNFTGINIKSGVNVVYKQEDTNSVQVIADADKLKYIITKVENGVLKIYVDSKSEKNLKFKNLTVNVSSPKLDNIEANSGSHFTVINTLTGKNINIQASSGSGIVGKFNASDAINVLVDSGSNMKGAISTEKFTFKGTSGSNASFDGNTNIGVLDISSGAMCRAENFKVNKANVQSTSGSSITVNVREKLDVAASSGGSVKYRGNPDVTSDISKSSGGILKQIN